MIETDVQLLKDELSHLRQEVQKLSDQVGRLARQRPMIVNEHPNIVQIERVQGGEPMIRDKYIPVSVIIAFIRQGRTPEEIIADYSRQLTLTDVYDALSYYHAHQEEIDSYLRAHENALATVSEIVRAKQAERAKRPS
jgi:uncharacterized protein (DUF433 family)